MKKLSLLMIAVFAIGLIFTSCGKKASVVEITELTVYDDAATGFSLKYPKNWFSQNNLGERFLSYTTKDVLKRFKTFDPEGPSGAKIDYQVVKLTDGMTIDTVMSKKLFEANYYSKPQEIMIDGVKGFKQTYAFPLGDGIFNGEIYYAQKDPTLVAVIAFEAFGGTFDTYKGRFDEIIKSVKLPAHVNAKSDTVKEIKEAPAPSTNLVSYKGDGFTISVPDNFDVKNPSGASIKSYKFDGERRGDCYILIDIIDASKQNKLEKIVQDNKAKFGNSEPRATTVNGQKAFVFEYNPSGSIARKAYFVIKGNRLYRIIADWNRVEDKDMFKPVFERSISTFRFQ